MIAIRDIIIFLAGGVLLYVLQLTHRYMYGKRISVSGLTRREEPYRPRAVETELPPVDTNRFNRLITEINTLNEFASTHSNRVKGKE